MDSASRLKLRKKARKLRLTGLSYKEIRKIVPVAKSTLSLWLKDVPLTPDQRDRLYTKQIQILSRGASSQKERRVRQVAEIIENGIREILQPISSDALKLFGAALYWAEGSKGKSFEMTNSDPRLILFMVRWIESIFQIKPNCLKAHLNIYSQQNDHDLKRFWSDLTKIPFENFGKTFVKPANKGYKKNNLYYGTIKVYIPKGTDMKHRVYGWTRAVLQNFENEVNLTERKWISLKETPRPVNIQEDLDAPIT